MTTPRLWAGATTPALATLALAVLAVAACTAGGAPTSPISPASSPTVASSTPTASVPAPSVTVRPSPSSPLPATGWVELSATTPAPAPRENHSWTVDPGAEVAYLFGGRDGATVFGDLWAYDLALDAWTEIEPDSDGPPARFGHSAAWVPDIGLVVFAGQAAPDRFFNDVWAYDPATNAWTALPGAGDAPLPRYGSCAALGPHGRLWISHGFTQEGNRYADTRTYDFRTGIWTDVTPAGDVPIARCLHGCFWMPGGDRLVLYGGQTTGVTALGDLWALSPGGAWAQLESPPTSPRNLYAFTPRASDTIVFGGADADGGFPTDTFAFARDLAYVRIDVAASPPGRRASQLVDDTTGGRVLLFGGSGEGGALADVWELAIHADATAAVR